MRACASHNTSTNTREHVFYLVRKYRNYSLKCLQMFLIMNFERWRSMKLVENENYCLRK